ncbi:sensor histidine kinase [Catenulispora subtropica]|uniref:sensor histidine kinase n=1 Tax=Catenulispora subtropica TaxID=450798 RepID=UPI0031D37F28
MLSTAASRIRGFRLRPPRRADVLLTLIILGLNTGGYLLPGVIPFGPWRLALEASAILPLLWRETYPVLSALVVGGMTLLVTSIVHPAQPFPYSVLVTQYTIGSVLRARTRVVMVGLFTAGNILAEILHKQTGNPEDFFVTFTLSLTSISLGLLTQSERDSAEVLADRAAAAERARIARDMHDVVGHAVALMVVQAEAGPLFVRSDPERAETAFDAISAAGRDAMTQLRALLGVLQRDDADRRDPVPTLAGLDDLVRRVRAAGLPVALEATGTPSALSPGAEAAAYRVVQEALTNTLKHARASRADVLLAWSPEALEITVADDGRGPAHGGAGNSHGGHGGHGLNGLRERLAPVGGRLSWSSPPDAGGFALTAYIPSES